MALQPDQGKLSCSVCLDLLKDPVTLACGHSFCMSCIKGHWDEEEEKKIYSCPRCKQTFTPRPVGVKTSDADIVEALKKATLQTACHYYATTGEVACDFCIGRKLKALKSCLVCRVSYCELHLQPHYESPAFEKHKLVKPLKNLQEKLCSCHNELMKIFCRNDQQTICILCSVDEHKDHNTVSAAAERNEKQRELGISQQKIQQKIQDREKDVKVLRQEIKAIDCSADKAVKDIENLLSELATVIERKRSAVKEQIRTQQEAEAGRVRKLLQKLEQEIGELRMKDAELEQLSQTDDHIQFLHDYPLLSHLSESTDSLNTNMQPLQYFEDVTWAVSDVLGKLQEILTEEWPKISLKVIEADVLLPHPEPRARDEFLRYYRKITLDPNTVNTWLSLSNGNRKATVMKEKQLYSSHPDRFTDWLQVLSRESLTGRCYWEVERTSGGVSVAVTYKDISRTGNDSGFGNNDKSWALGCFDNSYYFRHNNIRTLLSGPTSSRVGVYLDHRAGTLSFYSVSEAMTLLHKVQTTFTQPLYAGFWVYWVGDTAEVCELK